MTSACRADVSLLASPRTRVGATVEISWETRPRDGLPGAGLPRHYHHMTSDVELKHVETCCTTAQMCPSAAETHSNSCIHTFQILDNEMRLNMSCIPLFELSVQLLGWVIVTNGDGGCGFWLPIWQTRSPGRSAWSEGRWPLGAEPYSSHEPGELSQWLELWWQRHKHCRYYYYYYYYYYY